MSLFVASLNSGSNGNCYYVGNKHEAVLVDAGLSCRETESRMAKLKLSMQVVKAIFISHEHTDHIRGLQKLSRKYHLPVYSTPATLKSRRINLGAGYNLHFKVDESVIIGGLTVTPFVKQHDAADPVSFVVEGNGIKIGVITDIGVACPQVIHYFKQCHATFLESNYDEQMLEEGSYPLQLKKRIRGGHGHLSNREALQLFTAHKPSFMSHLFLSHLSKENNSPQLVQDLFNSHAGNTEIIIASRCNETGVFKIGNSTSELSEVKKATIHVKVTQMSMFEHEL